MIEFVPMKREHIDDLVRIEEQCFNSGFARATFEKELENKIAIYIVAVDDGRALGYAGLWNICGCADIIDVAVDRGFRRKGIAEGMLSALIDECKKQEVFLVNLEVKASNEAAKALYKKLGFIENGLRKRYYDNNEDAILMQKNLLKGEPNEDTCN